MSTTNTNEVGRMSKYGVVSTRAAEDHYSENYPYNVKPQFRSPEVEGKLPCLTCPPDYSKQALIFNDNELMVIKGWSKKATIPLKNFFIPVENFSIVEILVKPSNLNDLTTFNTIDFRTLVPENKVNFLCILPLYENLEEIDQENWKLLYKFDTQPNVEDSWRSIGRILFLSTFINEIEPVNIKNLTSENLYLKILYGV